MERFGIDKPDLRYGLEIRDLTPLIGAGCRAVRGTRPGRQGGRLRAIIFAPAARRFRRKDIDALTAAAKEAKAGGLIWARRTAAGWEGQGVKAVGQALLDALGGTEGDLLLAVAGPDAVTSPALHAVRSALGAPA